MQLFRRAALALLAGAALALPLTGADAADRTSFAGCVTDRAEKSITLATSSDGSITIDTSWLGPGMYDALSAECLTVTTLLVEGRYVAESVEAGDEPNEVHGIANGLTTDREKRADAQEAREKEDDDD
jgi:hypothetical protein